LATTNINVVVLSGNLTRDPELRTTPNGTPVCSMRIAVNKYVDGQERAGYFNVTAWAKQGELCAEYLSRGDRITVKGRLEWREVPATERAPKREYVDVTADPFGIEFPQRRDGGGGYDRFEPVDDLEPVDSGDFDLGPAGTDDDIPF
jgi:single-strand DNA-binding protein